MSVEPAHCVGGPLHGCMVPVEEGQTYFEVEYMDEVKIGPDELAPLEVKYTKRSLNGSVCVWAPEQEISTERVLENLVHLAFS